VLLKQHVGDHHQFHNHEEVEIAVHEHANATAWFILRRNFLSCAKMLEMHQCAQELRWKIILFQQNKWATFNILMISHYTPCCQTLQTCNLIWYSKCQTLTTANGKLWLILWSSLNSGLLQITLGI
jgi:hypothetical protein